MRHADDDIVSPIFRGLDAPIRTRSELIEFLGLVFSIPLPADEKFETLDDIAVAAGLAIGPVRMFVEHHLIRPPSACSSPRAAAEEVRLAMILGELLDLGCTVSDLAVLAQPPRERAIGSTPDHDAGGVDALAALRDVLARLEQTGLGSPAPRDQARQRRLGDLISSIDALNDLV